MAVDRDAHNYQLAISLVQTRKISPNLVERFFFLQIFDSQETFKIHLDVHGMKAVHWPYNKWEWNCLSYLYSLLWLLQLMALKLNWKIECNGNETMENFSIIYHLSQHHCQFLSTIYCTTPTVQLYARTKILIYPCPTKTNKTTFWIWSKKFSLSMTYHLWNIRFNIDVL